MGTRAPRVFRRISPPVRSSSGSPAWWYLRGRPHSPPEPPCPDTRWSLFSPLSESSPKIGENCQSWPGFWRLPCLDWFYYEEGKNNPSSFSVFLNDSFAWLFLLCEHWCALMIFSGDPINIYMYIPVHARYTYSIGTHAYVKKHHCSLIYQLVDLLNYILFFHNLIHYFICLYEIFFKHVNLIQCHPPLSSTFFFMHIFVWTDLWYNYTICFFPACMSY